MRIKVKTLRTLVFAGILAIGGVFAGGMITKKVAQSAFGETSKVGDYTCSDCVFGELHDNNHYISTEDIVLDGFKLTSFSNSKHCAAKAKEPSWTYKDSLMMVGSKGNTGSFMISCDYDCDKIMVYGKSWPGDASATVTASGVSNSTCADVSCMVFEFAKSKKITVSSNSRMLVQKIVVRLYTED